MFKESHITPLLKSPILDPDVLQSYRPVSNLTFLSKVLETAVSSQLIKYFTTHQLLALSINQPIVLDTALKQRFCMFSLLLVNNLIGVEQFFLVLIDL